MQRVYYVSPNQVQRKKKSCSAILLNKGEMTFQLGLQTDTVWDLSWEKYS